MSVEFIYNINIFLQFFKCLFVCPYVPLKIWQESFRSRVLLKIYLYARWGVEFYLHWAFGGLHLHAYIDRYTLIHTAYTQVKQHRIHTLIAFIVTCAHTLRRGYTTRKDTFKNSWE